MPKVIVITPTYNERQNVTELCRRIFALDIDDLKLIAIDDNSPDGTGKLWEELAKKYPIQILHRNQKEGYGTACLAGIKAALKQRPDFIIQIDADLSHNPKVIKDMLKEMKGYDLVIGSRYIVGGRIRKWGFNRRLLSRLANLYTRLALNLKINDTTSGFRCWRAKSLKKVINKPLNSIGYVFLAEVLFMSSKLNFKIKEVPITFTQRQAGISKLSQKVFWESFWQIMKLRFIGQR